MADRADSRSLSLAQMLGGTFWQDCRVCGAGSAMHSTACHAQIMMAIQMWI